MLCNNIHLSSIQASSFEPKPQTYCPTTSVIQEQHPWHESLHGLLWIAMDCWCAMANKAKYSSSSGLSLEVYWVAAHVIEEQQHPQTLT